MLNNKKSIDELLPGDGNPTLPCTVCLTARNTQWVAAWRSGNVIGRINKVTLRWARLVLGWVTVFCRQITSLFHQGTQTNSASYPQREGK